MRNCVQILVPDCGKKLQSDALVGSLRITRSAVDRYRIAQTREPDAQLFGKRFESPVVRRDSTRAENCDAWLYLAAPAQRLAARGRDSAATTLLGAGLLTGV